MIIKVLSANDVGKTNSHQAGMLIPKNETILDFFPKINKQVKNPRAELTFSTESGEKWKFRFIYYNNKYFGGTRNEYRLTCMTKYFKSKNLKVGDQLEFSKVEDLYFIKHKRTNINPNKDHIKLSDSWITVNI